ncbi:MAG: Gfo/Idh/MocA family oxidoreductase [Bryobacteraceae bacterium]
MNPLRVAVIGAGTFGQHHIRVISQTPGVELWAIVDSDPQKLAELKINPVIKRFGNLDSLAGAVDAAIVATPTHTHEAIATRLLEAGIDVLVEKPIADSSEAGKRLSRLAETRGRILQAGHLERFNPAVMALDTMITVPLFFEVHRLSMFTPRSLDIDVVLDLMIHDLDIVLSMAKQMPVEIRAAGISVLSPKVDIANVRLAFPSGCIANLTASRVSTEQVRKLRVFQPGQYISLDYARQAAVSFSIGGADRARLGTGTTSPKIAFDPIRVEKAEPLQQELTAFFQCVRDRTQPLVDGWEATQVLQTAEAIIDKIKEHGDLVAETIRRQM